MEYQFTREPIVNRLREFRLDKGYTQESLARKCEISTRYYIKIEKGEAFPSVYIASLICETLGVKREEAFPPENWGNRRPGKNEREKSDIV